MAFICFSASDPAAVNATNLYDYNNDDENLWISRGRLPLCSSSLSPPEFLCLVCLQIMVYAVCSNLTNGVRIVLEGVGVPVKIVKSGCPQLLSDVNTTVEDVTVDKPPSGQLSGGNIVIVLSVLMCVSLIVLVLCERMRPKRQNELQLNNQTEPLKQVQVQSGDDHMVQAD